MSNLCVNINEIGQPHVLSATKSPKMYGRTKNRLLTRESSETTRGCLAPSARARCLYVRFQPFWLRYWQLEKCYRMVKSFLIFLYIAAKTRHEVQNFPKTPRVHHHERAGAQLATKGSEQTFGACSTCSLSALEKNLGPLCCSMTTAAEAEVRE